MNRGTRRVRVDGPAGAIDAAIDDPPDVAEADLRGTAVWCHPHPQHGGTMDNKVVHTLARVALALGMRSVRFNFRGVGDSAGAWDDGRGEVDDALAVVAAQRLPGRALVLGGFSFGGFVAAASAQRLAPGAASDVPGPDGASRLVLVAPATSRFALPAVPADTIVVQGDDDEVVPLSATLAWARAQPQPQPLPVTVLPGVGHFFHGQLALLKDVVLRALR